MAYRQLTYKVRFLTPAFLGNAEQSGQWRTPPFKALLRQWWRVAMAEVVGYDHHRLRKREALLFGHAWSKDDRDSQGNKVAARASRVRIRIDGWSPGKLRNWNGLEPQKVRHPEVSFPVGAHLYLGYGPLDYDRMTRTTKLKNYPAIKANESGDLSVAVPDEHSDEIGTTLALMNAYGTLGGRSRNGWGSFSLTPTGKTPGMLEDLDPFRREYEDALDLEWPNSIGRDERGPLVWQTHDAYPTWHELMGDLAKIKIGIRTMFKFPNAKPPHLRPLDRHWLAYPVTRHRIQGWGNARLPNSLRFKVRVDSNNELKLRGVIFHVPCMPPASFKPDRHAIELVWKRVHRKLDSFSAVKLERIES